jgi:general secretion pathway protein G
MYGKRDRALARLAARRRQKGMTLLEIMIVIAILALIASVVVVAVMNQFERAKIKTAKLKIGEIQKALDLYKVDQGDFPSQSEGLQVLVSPPGGGAPYLKEKDVPKDPWGQGFVYYNPSRSGGAGIEVVSKGPDKQEGTQDDIKAGGE